ncbi:Pkinase-domain-containing protein [Trametes versicolor FP-101664 SS1]|uniref:Pkinase-domain-containing protein n=1 Tax=Trametes versicolor (strain FP-101664) TaxID=717944 RepID=UPI00046222F6|nr:Pkinase-domain-containing protein [Trametes versicolor FP-101664 SS1]EIW55646.1 Pkinase-domain-containing protein [Trametes versicolor FP-101664 SS1]
MSNDTASWIPEFLGKTIDDGRLLLTEVLGEGAYGVVFHGVTIAKPGDPSSSSGDFVSKEFAVKIMEKADPKSRRWRYQQREVAAHLVVEDHPNIVSIHGAYECDYFIYIVLDFCAGGDLFNPMMERFIYARNDELLKRVFVQVLDAVEYCHGQGIYHRDLKPDNILTNAEGTDIKLADFGLSTTAKVSDTFGCGSANYMSPECIGEDYDFHPFSPEAADVWSLGIILTNLVAGRNPWEYATTKDKNYLKFLSHPGHLRSILPISEETEEILYQIFSSDPATRITIPELRTRILAVGTFFMSEEDIKRGSRYIQVAAASYCPRAAVDVALAQTQSVFTDKEALQLIHEENLKASRTLSSPKAQFVICTSSDISDSSSSSSSSGSDSCVDGRKLTSTPATSTEKPMQLAEIPGYKGNKRIGAVMASEVRKGRSLPISSNDTPLVVTIAL